MPDPIAFAALNTALKAAGEETRLRMLALLAEGELTVSDFIDILRQSQPRISRHLKVLAEAGIVERFREGSWAFYRLTERCPVAGVVETLVSRLDMADATLAGDRERLAAVRAARAAAAQAYFRTHAAEWDRIRRMHVADEEVEAAMLRVIGAGPFGALLDLGTGTGRMLELFAARIGRGLGIDLSLDMLLLARARIERAGLRHCSIRQGDIYDLAALRDAFDVVIIHQVLHFLDDAARAVRQAARALRPGGRLLVVDFAPHEVELLREHYAHRRLGFSRESVSQWIGAAGLRLGRYETLPATRQSADDPIAVSLWLGKRDG